MMRPPENLTLPLPSSPFARHLFSPDLQIEGQNRSGSEVSGQVSEKWPLTINLYRQHQIPEFIHKFPV